MFFAVQVLGLEQSLMFEFQGTNYIFKVSNLLAMDKLSEQVGLCTICACERSVPYACRAGGALLRAHSL